MAFADSFCGEERLTEKASVEKAAEESGYREEVDCCKCCSRGGRCEDELCIRTRRRCSRMYQGTLDRQQLEEKRKHAGFLGGVS